MTLVFAAMTVVVAAWSAISVALLVVGAFLFLSKMWVMHPVQALWLLMWTGDPAAMYNDDEASKVQSRPASPPSGGGTPASPATPSSSEAVKHLSSNPMKQKPAVATATTHGGIGDDDIASQTGGHHSRGVHLTAFKQMALAELVLEAVPQLIIQIINTAALNRLGAVAVGSIGFSAFIFMSHAYTNIYYLWWKGTRTGRVIKDAWTAIPVLSASRLVSSLLPQRKRQAEVGPAVPKQPEKSQAVRWATFQVGSSQPEAQGSAQVA
jgi:hypothetical protein